MPHSPKSAILGSGTIRRLSTLPRKPVARTDVPDKFASSKIRDAQKRYLDETDGHRKTSRGHGFHLGKFPFFLSAPFPSHSANHPSMRFEKVASPHSSPPHRDQATILNRHFCEKGDTNCDDDDQRQKRTNRRKNRNSRSVAALEIADRRLPSETALSPARCRIT